MYPYNFYFNFFSGHSDQLSYNQLNPWLWRTWTLFDVNEHFNPLNSNNDSLLVVKSDNVVVPQVNACYMVKLDFESF